MREQRQRIACAGIVRIRLGGRVRLRARLFGLRARPRRLIGGLILRRGRSLSAREIRRPGAHEQRAENPRRELSNSSHGSSEEVLLGNRAQ